MKWYTWNKHGVLHPQRQIKSQTNLFKTWNDKMKVSWWRILPGFSMLSPVLSCTSLGMTWDKTRPNHWHVNCTQQPLPISLTPVQQNLLDAPCSRPHANPTRYIFKIRNLNPVHMIQFMYFSCNSKQITMWHFLFKCFKQLKDRGTLQCAKHEKQ